MKPFTAEQVVFINKGKKCAQMLEENIIRIFDLKKNLVLAKRHCCIAGGPGIGKTYVVNKIAEAYGIEVLKIESVSSMNALTIQLAVTAYAKPNETIFVWIDDCDGIFNDVDSLALLKGILDEDRNILSWNKNMTSAIQTFEKSGNPLDQIKADALRSFQTPDGVGVMVPTNNMRFIITTNRFLTPSNPTPKTRRKMDESAIRDRVDYKEFDLEWQDNWGWMAYITLNANLFDITEEQKYLLLDWMYINWKRLPSYSMRTIRELAADMTNYPDDYPDYWDARLMSKNHK